MQMNYNGLRCPQPVLKLTIAARTVKPGTPVEVLADCPQFPDDLKKWCAKNKKALINCTALGGGKFKAMVQF